MAKSKKLKFQTEKRTEVAKKKRFFLIFCIFLLLFAAVSVFVVLTATDFDLSGLFKGREAETLSAETTAAADSVPQGSANFLVWSYYNKTVKGTAETVKDISFIAVINVDLATKILSVCPLSSETMVNADGLDTLAGHFRQGGSERLKKAVEIYGGIKIDKYAGSNDTGFKTAIKELDKIRKLVLNIKEPIDSRKDPFLVLTSGEQTLTKDELLKYFQFNGQNGSEGLIAQADTLCAMLKQYINAATAEKGDELFTKLVNAVEYKDIDIYDYAAAKPALNMLSVSAESFSVQTVLDLSAFAEPATQAAKEETGS